jgi:hypothetical protein
MSAVIGGDVPTRNRYEEWTYRDGLALRMAAPLAAHQCNCRRERAALSKQIHELEYQMWCMKEGDEG